MNNNLIKLEKYTFISVVLRITKKTPPTMRQNEPKILIAALKQRIEKKKLINDKNWRGKEKSFFYILWGYF
jgi:hypothetical protein